MKIFVDEMPFCKQDCPFSEEIPMSRYDKKTKRHYRCIDYECILTKDFCDLDCDTCSGLRVLKTGETND